MCRYHRLFGRLLEPAVELGSVRSALELESPMLSNSDRLENDATQESRPCANCGHVHVFIDGVCDAEIERNIQTPGYAEMDVISCCTCMEYIPEDRESILERENKL